MKKNKYAFITIFILFTSFFSSASKPISNAKLPSSAYISGVIGHAQSNVLSCESRSAVDLMQFWGFYVSETTFFNSLPSSDNPNRGFVGRVNGAWGNIPPNSYGVHAEPIAQNLRFYGLDALAYYGFTFEKLQQEIAAGRPVIVWVIGDIWAGTAINYTSSDGETNVVARYEHSMILIGYDQNYVYLVNASNGATETHSISNFIGSWAVLGNQAIVADLDESLSTETPAADPIIEEFTETYIVKSGDYLTKLGQLWGVRWQDIASLNGITYPYTIHTGQVLKTSMDTSSQAPSPSDPPPPKITEEPEQITQQPQETYTVQRGDHLSAIARMLGLSWVEIAKLNNLYWPYTLYAGNVLYLPGSGGSTPTENIPAPSTPIPSAAPPPSGESYTIQKGDYLVQLGRDLGISWLEIASINHIYYPYIVYPGQIINIP